MLSRVGPACAAFITTLQRGDRTESDAEPWPRTERSAIAARLLTHVENWLAAIEAQPERIRVGIKEIRPERWADAYLYAYALRNLLGACREASKLDRSGSIRSAADEFEAAIPGVVPVRNALDKFHKEERVLGGLVVWAGFDGDADLISLTLHVEWKNKKYTIDVEAATQEARRLAGRCRVELVRLAQSS